MSIAHPLERPEVELDDDGPGPGGDVRTASIIPHRMETTMGESDWHCHVLGHALRHAPGAVSAGGAYVAIDMMFYYEEGNPQAVRSPDCMVVLGVRELSPPFLDDAGWKGRCPRVVFELISKRTRREDLGRSERSMSAWASPNISCSIPIGTIFRGRTACAGWRLEGGPLRRDRASSTAASTSEQLGLLMNPEGEILRLVDLATLDTLKTMRGERQPHEDPSTAASSDSSASEATAAPRKAEQAERLRAEEQTRIAQERDPARRV